MAQIKLVEPDKVSFQKIEATDLTQEVRVVKFIEEWKVYPNGTMYFVKKYPIGQEKARISSFSKGRKKKVKTVKQKKKPVEVEEL